MKQRYIALAAALMMTAGSLASCGSADTSSSPYNGANGGDNNISYVTPHTDQSSIAGDTSKDKPENSGLKYDGNAEMSEEAENQIGADTPLGEEYAHFEENGFKLVKDEPLSTFSTDVDTASYANARRMLNEGSPVWNDAVRTEEFINYFSYDYAAPAGSDPIAITTELSDRPNAETKLLLVGVRAKEIEQTQRPPMNVVLLIDVSGSMSSEDKLPLAQKAFLMLAESLDENDRLSIVTYSGEEKIVLEGAKGSDYQTIEKAVMSLTAGGATAGEAGINMAYSLAEKYFIKGGNNRIVMATDGDLNVGVSSAEELTELIEKKREGGVFLSVLGFGTGNFKDSRLEALADNGNGNYSYIDSEREAKKVLVSELQGTLYTVAKDVKAQIEFNPAAVAAYRLVGYENRLLNDEDFTDDTKDAGDMGAGHTVTVLYEIVPAKGVLGSDGKAGIELKYQTDEQMPQGEYSDELATVKLRYKQPDGDQSKEISGVVKTEQYTEELPKNLAFAYCAASFADFLKKGSSSATQPKDILTIIEDNGLDTDEYRKEFAELVAKAYTVYRNAYDDIQ